MSDWSGLRSLLLLAICHWRTIICRLYNHRSRYQVINSAGGVSRPYTNVRVYATLIRLYRLFVVCTEYIVYKRCVLEQKLLLTAYRKSYMRNRLVPKWMTLTFV